MFWLTLVLGSGYYGGRVERVNSNVNFEMLCGQNWSRNILAGFGSKLKKCLRMALVWGWMVLSDFNSLGKDFEISNGEREGEMVKQCFWWRVGVETTLGVDIEGGA